MQANIRVRLLYLPGSDVFLVFNNTHRFDDSIDDWSSGGPEVMAASVTALAPILAATFILQKHIAQGLTSGAVKG
jgi:ABC-type glycerol-3-phosphate transport system permease component